MDDKFIANHITHANVLVIKLGALGDFIQALGAMAAIRRYHPKARITLLTTAPYVDMARASGYVDDIQVDTKPRWHDWRGWLELARFLNGGKFTRVYDLQNNDRTAIYFRLLRRPKPEWVGAARGASHCNDSAERTAGHAFDGHKQTLALAGVQNVRLDDLSWMKAPTGVFSLHKPYVLLIPGSAPGRPEKRWPADSYARLAQLLAGTGYQPVIIGTRWEKNIGRAIEANCPTALNLVEQTSITELAAIARDAAGAIGNDTGPMHLIAATGCPTLVLFSPHSDAVRNTPLGAAVASLQTQDLNTLTPEKVLRRFKPRQMSGNASGTVH